MIRYKQLGPLEFVAGEWIIGDPAGCQTKYLKLQRQGISHWVGGAESEVIPWSRLMDLNLSAEVTRLGNSKVLSKLTDIALAFAGGSRLGGGEAYLAATLRNPYEDWIAHFTHAVEKYDRHEIRMADEFLRRVVESGRAAILGDPRWVATAVERIASLPPAVSRNLKSAIGEIIRS